MAAPSSPDGTVDIIDGDTATAAFALSVTVPPAADANMAADVATGITVDGPDITVGVTEVTKKRRISVGIGIDAASCAAADEARVAVTDGDDSELAGAPAPSPKKRRSSYGPAHGARRKAFLASKEPRTTSAPSTQIGAGTRGAGGRGI